MIYIDSDFRCHATNPEGIYREVDTDFFVGKCDTYIEGFRFVPSGESWTREDGEIFAGEMIAPCENFLELYSAQMEFEKSDAQTACEILLGGAE